MPDESKETESLLPTLAGGQLPGLRGKLPALDRTCPVCGRRCVQQAKFCDKCGAKLDSSTAAVVQASPGAAVEKPGGSPAGAVKPGGASTAVTWPDDAARRHGFSFLYTNTQGYKEYRHDRSGMVFVLLPGGAFDMGSPETEPKRDGNEKQHRVTLSPFLIGKYAASQGEWKQVMGTTSTPSKFGPADELPVEWWVSWDACRDFFANLNGRKDDEKPATPSFWFPTEAQREYACRAGTKTPFSFGAYITPAQVNYDGDYPYPGGVKGLYRGKTVAVGSLPGNGFGLYEMHGNVWEWCADIYDEDFYSSSGAAGPDPLCLRGGSADRVLRGGSWLVAGCCRSADRYRDAPGVAYDDVGVRPSFFPLT